MVEMISSIRSIVQYILQPHCLSGPGLYFKSTLCFVGVPSACSYSRLVRGGSEIQSCTSTWCQLGQSTLACVNSELPSLLFFFNVSFLSQFVWLLPCSFRMLGQIQIGELYQICNTGSFYFVIILKTNPVRYGYEQQFFFYLLLRCRERAKKQKYFCGTR